MRKYNNTKREYDGHKFDSLKELARYKILSVWLACGIIRELKLQEPFVLAPAVILTKYRFEIRGHFLVAFFLTRPLNYKISAIISAMFERKLLIIKRLARLA